MTAAPAPRRLPIDSGYLMEVLIDLLEIPSPTGRTDHVQQYIGERLAGMGIDFELTRRGSIQAVIPGRRNGPVRGVVVHSDTIGCIVTGLKDNGRLAVRPVGTHSARFSEGADVRVFTDDLNAVVTGTVLPLKASGHRYNDQVDTQGVGWEQVEVRVDAPVHDAAGLRGLGVNVGDLVALISHPTLTATGYIKARHLDDKAGVAAVLAAVRSLLRHDVVVPVDTHILVTCFEEIGHGASHGIHPELSEMVGIDTAVVAPGQESREDLPVVVMGDGVGPFDYHLSRRLIALAEEHGIGCVRDVFEHYRSDLASAVESGADTRTALLAFGVDATHGWERTHLDGLIRLAKLVTVYLQSDLVFPEWDATATGDLEDFPSLAVQPASEEGPREGPIGVEEPGGE